jgi:hypothetical protein
MDTLHKGDIYDDDDDVNNNNNNNNKEGINRAKITQVVTLLDAE